MRVALSVDAIEPNLSGIGRYTLELVRGLTACPEIDSLRFFRGREPIANPEALLAAHGDRKRNRLERWWVRRRDASSIAQMKSSIIHSPNFFLPDWADGGIATIHDLSVFRFPEMHPKARIADFERRFASTIRRADHVITGTAAMQAELIATLGLDAKRLSVVAHGVHRPDPLSDTSLRSLLAEVGLAPGGYSLCVATIEPRKRIGELLDAYSRLPVMDRDRYPLVIVGKNGWLSEAIVEKIEQARSAGWATWLGFTTDAMLNALYFGARLFIYPSRYEGFGLPPIEAMARDVPVLISDDPSLVEISGKAAKIVDADDAEAFAGSIAEALSDETWRREAIDRGRDVVRSLGWDRTVARTVEVYRRAAR